MNRPLPDGLAAQVLEVYIYAGQGRRYVVDSSGSRTQAECALRLARDSTDVVLIEQLKKAAAEFTSSAEAQEKLDRPIVKE